MLAPSKPDLTNLLADIRTEHRQRVFAMDQRKRSDLALGAFLRTQLGWSKSLPKEEAKAISERAAALIDAGKHAENPGRKKPPVGLSDPAFKIWASFISATLKGRSGYDMIEEGAVARMELLAAQLPAAAWWNENVFKSSYVSLAVIIAETGDLSLYANPGKVWKRMGLAVMNGIRQGGLRKTASAEDWIAHGYSARRRSFMWVIGDALIKKQGHYRDVYLARKAYEIARAQAAGLTVCPSAKIPAKRKAEFMSDGHVHRRSQRYTEKCLLRDLWQAWREATHLVSPKLDVPSATHPAYEAGRPAIDEVLPKAALPGASIPAPAGPMTIRQVKPTKALSSALNTRNYTS